MPGSRSTKINLEDELDVVIGPATEAKQDTIITLLSGGINLQEYDKVTITTPNTTTEVYTFELATVTTDIVTAIYTDATKALISTATKT